MTIVCQSTHLFSDQLYTVKYTERIIAANRIEQKHGLTMIVLSSQVICLNFEASAC